MQYPESIKLNQYVQFADITRADDADLLSQSIMTPQNSDASIFMTP